MIDFSGLYDVRDMEEQDVPFIASTFLKGLYHGDSWFTMIPRGIFMDNYKKVIHTLLKDSRSAVKIACLKDDKDVILGYSILSPDYQNIHYVFVKSAWRKKGIARSLLPKYPVACTHLTAVGRSLMSKFEGMVFNPFNV